MKVLYPRKRLVREQITISISYKVILLMGIQTVQLKTIGS